MDYNAIWQGLTKVDENTHNIEQGPHTYIVDIPNATIISTPTLEESLKRQQWISIKLQIEAILDDLDNIKCDIEPENHVYDYSSYATITDNICTIHDNIQALKKLIERYKPQNNG